jgi:GPI mannosyltransferase 3
MLAPMFAVLHVRRYRLWFGVSLALSFLAAIFASGYHHPDEYVQIVEFANLKLGGTTPANLSWEFGAAIRSWFQPTLFVVLSRILHTAGLDDPFWQIGVFRMFHGVLGWLAMTSLASYLLPRLASAGQRATDLIVGSCAFLFFVPWFFTRTSSESLGTSLMILAALCFLASRGRSADLLAGLLGGLACIARFQMGIMVVGLFAWAMVFRTKRPVNWALAACGLAISLTLGLALDWWGYGRFVLSPYEYVYQNIVLDKAAQFGVRPVWYYLVLMQQQPMPVHSALLTFACVAGAWRFPRNPFVWMAVPLVLVHSAIPHKEMRFLLPVAALSPVFLSLAVLGADGTPDDRAWLSRVLSRTWLVRVLVWSNAVALVIACIWPMRSELLLQRYLWTRHARSVSYYGDDPYSIGTTPVVFLRPAALTASPVGSMDAFLGRRPSTTGTLLVSNRILTVEKDALLKAGCHNAWRAFPAFVESLNFNHWLERAGDWTVYECR